MLCGNGRERSETARIPSETLQDGITYADLMRFMTAAYRSGQRDRPSPSNTLGASRWIGMIAFGFGVDHAVCGVALAPSGHCCIVLTTSSSPHFLSSSH